MAKARRPLGCGVRKFGILLTVMAAAIIALPNTVTNDVVVATSDAELRISDRDLGLGLEVVGGGAAEVKLETRPGWRFRDGRTVVTLNKAAGEVATSPEVEGEGKGAESYVPGIDVGDDDEDDEDGEGDEDGSVEHEKPVLSLSASAPRIVAYSVNDGGASVSISLSATVTKEGIHREVDSGGNVIEEKNFSPQRYSWTMSGADSATKETSSDTCTFTARLTKGENKVLNFSVVGKDCEYCDEDVETSAATDSVTIDVYELSISRDPYLGLNRTDEGRKSRTVKDANVAVSPVFSGTTNVLWTACGICEFVGPTNQTSVQYRNKDFETASESVGKERLAASVTLAGMDSSVVCSTNFTVVKVDVKIGDVDENKEESEGSFALYVSDELDELNGSITVEGTNKMVAVSFSCEPKLPGGETVTVSFSGAGELYEKLANGELVKVTAKSFPASGITSRAFRLHGHDVSSVMMDVAFDVTHSLSSATDKSYASFLGVEIWRNGCRIDVDDMVNTIIGEANSLVCIVQPSCPRNVLWDIPGTRVRNWYADDNASCLELLTDEDLRAVSVKYYWVDAMEKGEVVCRLGSGNGTCMAKRKFNVLKPASTISTSCGCVSINKWLDHLEVSCGSMYSNGFKAEAVISLLEGHSGRIEWVQIANPQRRRLYNTGRRLIWSGEGLDGGYPYDTGGIVTDSPGTTLLPSMNVVAVNDSFKMYLMFKIDAADAIWVPLKLVAWGWSAEVSRQGDSWTLVSHSNPEPEVHDTSQHPVWNRKAQDNQWHDELNKAGQ